MIFFTLRCQLVRPSASKFFSMRPFVQARQEGGQKGSLSGDTGGPGFRIVRFGMQNSSAQTTACGRDDVFFLFRAEIRTSADAMTLFCSSLDVEPKFHPRKDC